MTQKPCNFFTMILALILLGSAPCAFAQGAEPGSIPRFDFNNSFGGTAGTDPSVTNAVHALEKAQQRADEQYKAERYERAFSMYKTLAEYGDKFSQYRVAFMHQHGRGVPQDPMQTFAWSYLAAENGEPGFVKYHKQVRKQFTGEDLKRAKQLAGEYLRDYGTYAQASRARGLISREMRKCSGSRTGATCNKVSSSGWQCGLASGNDIPDPDCLTLGMVGIPALVGLQPADMRKAQKNLALLQDRYNPGRVELGELEVVDDEQD